MAVFDAILTLVLPPIWGAIGGAILGVIAASYVATLLRRWPRGQSASHGRSGCEHCGATLRWFELLPILSFVIQRGRCRRCAQPIAADHFWVELAGFAIGAAIGWFWPMAQGLALLAGAMIAILLFALDARHQWLPHRLSWALAIWGLALGGWALAGVSAAHFTDRLVGLALGYASLTGIAAAYRWWSGRDGLGGGDPPLFAAIGAIGGWQILPATLFLASLGGLAVAAVRLARARGSGDDWRQMRLPLGSLLLLALPFAMRLAP